MPSLDWIQWPAMLSTASGAYLTASTSGRRRAIGFWIFLLSNVLWAVWGWAMSAPATVCLQVILAVLNVRGAGKSEDEEVEGKS
ncbi:hypothetical protein [Planctomyces sp. SH-PL14]|jgi:hypothetical protein|uniref:hypothetical protein n=1 Tax=Planctomyces sp. SH-PL14 TaxID=1632864 RepID=UPI00078D07A2|nr:hypothetical protein [Planctomyces sp. SH-PL14]AMV22435.1 hypothetical protein VT03_31360 [Planctomyces sp. SH-PL14]